MLRGPRVSIAKATYPPSEPIGDRRRMAGDAPAAMQHHNGRIGRGISGCRGYERGQTGTRPRQITDEMHRLQTREVWKFNQSTPQRRPIPDKRGDDNEEL